MIGIDYTPALKQGAGIGRYTRGLISGLAQIAPTLPVRLWAARDAILKSGVQAPYPLSHLPLSERAATILWQRLRVPLPVEVFTGALDIFHSPDFVLPPLRRGRGLITIHDLSFMVTPHCAHPNLRAYLTAAVPRALRRADLILADSENTAHDLTRYLDVAPEKMRVVLSGVSPDFKPVTNSEQIQTTLARYKLEQPYILHVGTLEPRKNLPTAIAALALLRDKGFAHRLVLIGGKGWLYDGIFEAIRKHNLSEHVIFPGFVADADLPTLYTAADAFVFPSLYEGFGIPPLEAMACGTPVVCANNSSLPEVVGDAALMIQAEDVTGLALALQRIFEDKALAADLRQRGLQRARLFSWTRGAGQLLEAYRAMPT